MQDNISVLLATIVFVILIVLFPIYNVATRQDSISSNIVTELTTEFVDSVRNKGYLAEEDYNNYLDELAKTGNMYDVELEAHKKKIVKDKGDLYTEAYEKDFTKDILETLEKEATNVEENASEAIVLANCYQFNEGDRFYVRVKNTNMTQAQVLLFNIFRGVDENRILVNYGGEVFTEEWARSNLIENVSSNIYISRPMDVTGVEYTNKVIAINSDIYDGEEGVVPQVEYVYGIVVTITLDMTEVYFDLNYSKVKDVISVDEITEKITLSGFDGNISVDEIIPNEKYKISITDVEFSGDKSKCNIKVGAGTATTETGFEVSSAISPEFVLYKSKEKYSLNGDLQAIQYNTSPADFDVGSHGYVTKPTGTNPIKIKFTAPTEAQIGRGRVRYIWTISNIGNKPKSITTSTGEAVTWLTNRNSETGISMIQTETNEISVEFDEEKVVAGEVLKGSYVKVVTIDDAGIYSFPSGVAFATVFDYLSKGFSTFDVQLSTMALSGATVDSATFTLKVSSGHGTSGRINNGDRYRIIGTDLSGRKVILIDKEIDTLKSNLVSLGDKTNTKSYTGLQKTYSERIKKESSSDMYYIDDNGNDICDSDEYYVANDITLSGYNTQLGFKTATWGYGSGSKCEDYSLYYFVNNSLDNLQIEIVDEAKTKYRYLTFDYKIMQGHGGCLGYSSQKINCTIKSYFEE